MFVCKDAASELSDATDVTYATISDRTRPGAPFVYPLCNISYAHYSRLLYFL